MKNCFLILMLFIFLVKVNAQSLELVSDIDQGPANGMSSYDDIAFIDDKMIFAAKSDDFGKEVYMIDEDQLVLLKDINIGSSSSLPSFFFEYQDEVYFSILLAGGVRQIWKTNGTKDGTVLAIEFSGPTTETPEEFLTTRGNNFYFTRNQRLFVSNGSQEGTFEVSDSIDIALAKHPTFATINADRFENGIAFVLDRDTVFQLYSAIDTNLYFLGQLDFASLNSFSVLGPFEVERGLLLAVRNGDSSIGDLYLYDKQTGLIEKYNTSKIVASRINRINDDKILITTDSNGNYVTDGTEAGTYQITSTSATTINGINLPFVRIGDAAIFHGNEPTGVDEVFATDGSIAGTRLIASIESNYISNFISKGQYAFWMTDIGFHGEPEVWAADINGTGASMLYKHSQLESNHVINPLGATDDKIYFVADINDDIGKELYSLDHNLEITGLNNILKTLNYQLIQNRESGTFKIITENDNSILEIEIYNMLGRLISSFVSTNNEWNDLPIMQGAYAILVRSSDGFGVSLIVN